MIEVNDKTKQLFGKKIEPSIEWDIKT